MMVCSGRCHLEVQMNLPDLSKNEYPMLKRFSSVDTHPDHVIPSE